MGAKISWKNCLGIGIIFLIFFSNISMAKSESLHTLLIEKKDSINENYVILEEECPPFLYSLIENRILAIHTPDGQIVGLIVSNGEIVEIIQGEPESTTIDIFADIQTIKSFETPNDFIRAWREGRIKVIFRNPITSHPIASSVALAGGVSACGFFYYFNGNYYTTKKSLFAMFSMLGLIKRKDKIGVEKEMATERVLFSILGWEGKGYKPKNNYARLLIGNTYLLNCRFTPLKDFKQVKIKLRYDDDKLTIDDCVHYAELPESKIYRISTKTEGLPELQTEATDIILICVKWEDGLKEEGLIKIPIAINRNVFDGISYTTGNIIKWIGGITGVVVVTAYTISPIISSILIKICEYFKL